MANPNIIPVNHPLSDRLERCGVLTNPEANHVGWVLNMLAMGQTVEEPPATPSVKLTAHAASEPAAAPPTAETAEPLTVPSRYPGSRYGEYGRLAVVDGDDPGRLTDIWAELGVLSRHPELSDGAR